MERLTIKYDDNSGYGVNEKQPQTQQLHIDFDAYDECVGKLGQLEDIEQELGIDLITLFKVLKEGIYYIDKTGTYDEKEDKWIPTINYHIVRGADLDSLIVIDNLCYYPECDFSAYYKDYGKDWALTKDELEKRR